MEIISYFHITLDDEGWSNTCLLCLKEGDLILCEFKNCSSSFHIKCIDLNNNILNNKSIWYCPGCPDKSNVPSSDIFNKLRNDININKIINSLKNARLDNRRVIYFKRIYTPPLGIIPSSMILPTNYSTNNIIDEVSIDDVPISFRKPDFILPIRPLMARSLPNVDKCVVCMSPGKLICCDNCPNSFHLSCAGLNKTPAGTYICQVCTGDITHDQLREKRLASRNMYSIRQKIVEIAVEEPTYDVKLERFCSFCKKTGDDAALGGIFYDSVNDFIGPWWEEEKKLLHFAHRKCVIWSPQAYVSGGQYYNVLEEIARSRQLICNICHLRCASIGCIMDDCRKSYHISCAEESGCYINEKTYAVVCPEHYFSNVLYEAFRTKGDVRNYNTCIEFLDKYDAVQEALVNKYKRKSEFLSTSSIPFQQLDPSLSRRNRIALPSSLILSYSYPNRNTEDEEISRRERIEMVKDKTKPYESKESEEFDSVGGLSEHVNVLKECVLLPLIYPEIYNKFDMKPSRGVLLYGPPGNGKTSLARALSKLCSQNIGGKPITFYVKNANDVLSKFYGEAEKALRNLFQKAKETSPSVIFFDEFDAMCPVRSAKQNQVHSSLVTTMLSLMDGIDDAGRIFVIAATNRVDCIDPALRRPGRFDRELYISCPNNASRLQILKYLTKWPIKEPISETLLQQIADRTCGWSGAEIKGLCTELFLHATKKHDMKDDLFEIDDIQIDITSKDFHDTCSKYASTLKNSNLIPMEPLSTDILPLLSLTMNTCLSYLSDLQLKKDSNIFPIYRKVHRLLIYGEGPSFGQLQIAKSVLYALDSPNIVIADFSTIIAASNPCELFNEKLTQFYDYVFGKCDNTPIFFLPNINLICKISTSLRALVVSFLMDINNRSPKPCLVLATSSESWNCVNIGNDAPLIMSFFGQNVEACKFNYKPVRRNFFRNFIQNYMGKLPDDIDQICDKLFPPTQLSIEELLKISQNYVQQTSFNK